MSVNPFQPPRVAEAQPPQTNIRDPDSPGLAARIRRGRTIVMSVAGFAFGFSLLMLLRHIASLQSGQAPVEAVWLLVLAALLHFTYLGRAWARYLVAALFLITSAAVFSIAGPTFRVAPLATLISLLLAAAYGTSGLALIFSPSVRAFARHQREQARTASRRKQ